MYIPDLTPLEMPPVDGSAKLIAIGWLESGCEYRCGDVAPDFVAKLADLLVNPWQPAVAAGHHPCGFCRFSGGPASFRLGGPASSSEVQMGVANLWVPADGFDYVAPSLILHYIDAHEYAPPTEFQAAVMACPPMRSMDYLKALRKIGSIDGV